MTDKLHHYRTTLEWTGNTGTGTSAYTEYERDYTLSADGKQKIAGSADAVFRGDNTRWNPEDLLVASLSACHELWYLHLCAVNNVIVTVYEDRAEGEMKEDKERGGFFTKVVLHPHVTISAESDAEKALDLHHRAHELCFVANSVNFPVTCEAVINSEKAS